MSSSVSSSSGNSTGCACYILSKNERNTTPCRKANCCVVFCSIKDHEEAIVRACALDLNKPRFETEIAESGWLLNDIVFTTRNLHKWVKDEKAHDIDLPFKVMRPKIRKDPLGCVLVIGYVLLSVRGDAGESNFFGYRL